ncbi:hypothetical protein GN157_04950 [Flavobacterium rakeshii]|uniref:Uncharacterized protein n=1 Tax=Flavobacterium rakeshii TaxID=1038845 RepID=A0A6N8H975_9FLAO|nr:hypothetical protein [Flavobacterium rakeshii]MUV03051.1 hypothetical protein [Flavobacterium rakeshii]
MTAPQKELWDKISNFRLDDPDASFTFSARLARENGWTKEYTNSVIEEYRKFIFLCCVSKSSATPSDPVNQVWHLHLTYTKSYWINFCKSTLQREIHHNPTKDTYLLGIVVAISIQASGGIGVGIVILIGFIIAIYSAIKMMVTTKAILTAVTLGVVTTTALTAVVACAETAVADINFLVLC